MAEPDTLEGEKIILMGLDNGGKTSILLSLKGDRNLMTYFSLKPTPGIQISEITSLNQQYYVWDFGGQESYRQQYIEDLPKYLKQTNRIIFVIDIQDQARMDQALEYFNRILEILQGGKYKIKLSIYLHKYDPDRELDDTFGQYAGETIAKIKKMIPTTLQYQIFKSTIYTLFRKTVIR